MKQKTIYILLFAASLIFSGCAGAKIKNKPAKDSAQIKNVYATIRQLLEHGDIICVMVHYKSSYEGLLSDEKPEDYGCEADPGYCRNRKIPSFGSVLKISEFQHFRPYNDQLHL